MSKNNKNGSDNLIDRINQSPDMQLKIIQHFIPQATLKKSFKTHEENTPSSSIKLHEGKYWLKNFASSDIAMDCFNIAEKELAIEMPEVIRYLIQNLFPDYGYQKQVSSNQRSAFEKQIFAIKNNPINHAKAYLEGRGIECDKLPVGSFYQNLLQDKKSEGIVFFDSKERLINKRYFEKKQGRSDYLNQGDLNGALYTKCYQESKDTVFITEGVINTLSLYPVYSSIAIFSATNKLSKTAIEPFIQDKKIVLALDNDKGGNEAAEILFQNIMDWDIPVASIHRLVFPHDKDVNDLLKTEELSSYLRESKNYKQLFPDYIPDSPDEDLDLEKKKFCIRNSRYFVNRYVRGKLSKVEISNFVMKILYFLPGDDTTSLRVFFAQNSYGESKYFPLSSRDMDRSNINRALRNKGGFSFYGTAEELEHIYMDLYRSNEYLESFEKFFLQPDGETYVFRNGIINKGEFIPVSRFGTVKLGNKSLYFPKCNSMIIDKKSNSKKKAEDKSYHFKKGELNFSLWSELFCKAYGDNGRYGLVFTIGALFRDIIGKHLRFFPHLYLFGDGGVGKSTYADFIIKLLGVGQIGIGASGSSVKGLTRHISSATNGIIFLREFTAQKERQYLEILKLTYDLGNLVRADFTNDNETINIALSSAFIIDANFILSKWSALVSRVDTLDFKHLKFDKESTSAKEELEDKAESGLGGVLLDILKQREYFSKNFRATFTKVFHEIKYKDKNAVDMGERGIKHVAMYLAIYECLKNKLNFPFNYTELKDIVFKTALKQAELLSRTGEINNFWITINTLKDRGKISDDNFRFRERDGKKILLIKYDTLYDIYKEECIQKQEEWTDRNSLLGLLKNHKSKYPGWQASREHTANIKGWGNGYTFEFEKLPLEKELWLK